MWMHLDGLPLDGRRVAALLTAGGVAGVEEGLDDDRLA
jgi:hypothetical protein